MKNRGIGFYVTLVACVLTLIATILYSKAMYTTTYVYVALIAAIVIEALAFVLNNKILNNWLPILEAVLVGFAIAHSFSVMVNQIGYVVAGLDTMETLKSFITFAVVAGVAMLLNMISGFMTQQKN